MATRPKLLGVGFAQPGFGFGRVFENLYRRLLDAWDIEHLEFSPVGVRNVQRPWTVHQTRRPAVFLGHLEFPALLDKVRPDLVFLYVDIWQIPPYLQAIEMAVRRPAVAVYTPIDGWLEPFSGAEWLAKIDRLILPTRFAQDSVLEMLRRVDPRLKTSLEIIPHGVDCAAFSAHSGITQQDARTQLFPERPDVQDGFIVLNANRNQPRKRLDLSIAGFAQFLAETDAPAYLYLHCGLRDQGDSILGIAKAHGIAHRLLLSAKSLSHPVVNDDRLNLIYNACDIGLNTASGEGWGLIAFEHAAVERAQMVPDHSACRELWHGKAYLIAAKEDAMFNGGVLRGSTVDVNSVANGLLRLWSDQDYRENLAEACLQNALRPEFNWDAVATRFNSVFQTIMQ